MKWKEDYSAETQRLFGLIVGFGAGALITAVLLGFLCDWGIVKGARWWEVMTAIGTVGAVIVALFFGLRSEFQNSMLRKYRLDSTCARISNRVSVHLINLDWVIKALHTCGDVDEVGVAGLTRLWLIENITDEDVLELANTYENAYLLIQIREKLLALLRLSAIPREHDVEQSGYDFQKIFSLIKNGETVKELEEMYKNLIDIRNRTAGL